jgi:DNA-binding NarL/FixJ family response regulator
MNMVAADSSPGSNQEGLDPATHSQTNKPGVERTIRVLLADDHPVVRWGLTCSVGSRKDIVIAGEAADGMEAVRKAKELGVDVVLMDIEMPGLDGLTATEILRRENPSVKVLLLSMHPFTGQMARVLQSGARGFLLKDARPADVINAIAKVAAGETCFGPDAARQALNQYANSHGGQDLKTLSGREREVLIGIAEGLGNKEIAARLGISARTVETHRCHVMEKLKIRSIAGLTRFAILSGLVTLKQDPEP